MKTKVLVGASVLALIAAAVVLKLIFFPSIKNAYFATDVRSLRQVPVGLVVLRPTHFPFLRRNGIFSAPPPRGGGAARRMMGRNVPLRDVVAAAYGENPSRVLLPPDAPKGHYDFLVSTARNPRQQLQSVIRRKLGYVAQKETRETDVLALKVANPSLPGLKVSGAKEKQNIFFNDINLRFTHIRVAVMTDVLQQTLKIPVIDKTGLTNFYDFSVAWDAQTQRRLDSEATARATVNRILDGLGLRLEPDTASLQMLVVKKPN